MSALAGLSLTDFTAYDLPPEKWMKLVSPKMRLRVGGKKRNFVSSVVKLDNRRPDAGTDISCTHWPWNDGERCSRPSFAKDELFEIVIERRFLLGYKCILRTKSVTIKQVHASSRQPYTLSLYDGQYSAGGLEDRVEIGTITFTLS